MKKFDLAGNGPFIGQKIKLKGTIRYGQDHGFWEHDFGDLEFTINSFLSGTDKVQLVAPDYGEQGTGRYGNGAIFVGMKYFEEHVVVDEQ